MHADLPFLITHDTHLWLVLIPTVALAVVGGLGALRRRRARHEARWKLGMLDSNDEGVVRGKLGGATVASVASISGYVADYTDWRAGDVWIDTAEGRVAVVATVRVLAGSQAGVARGGVPRATPDELIATNPALHRYRPPWRATIVTSTFESVSPGDEVIARGRLEHSVGEGGDYRQPAVKVLLHGLDDGLVHLASRSPRAAVARRSLPVYVAIVALCGLVTWRAAIPLGDHWRDACWDDVSHDDAPVRLSSFGVCGLAAAMPDSRHRALSAARHRIEDSPYRDATTVANLIALARLAGGCDDATEHLMDLGRYDDAAGEARRCGNRRAEHVALVMAGRFDEAVQVAVPGDANERSTRYEHGALPTGKELVLAGRWREAAGAITDRAAALGARPYDADQRHDADIKILGLRCSAELFRSWGGDAGAAARLRALAAGDNGVACAPAMVELASDDELAHMPDDETWPRNYDVSSQLRDLRWLRGQGAADSPFDGPEAVLSRPDDVLSWSSAGHAWIAKHVAGAIRADAPPLLRAETARWLAVARVLDGDIAGATAAANDALAAAHDVAEHTYAFDDLPLLPKVIALYTPAIDATFSFDDLRGHGAEHDSTRFNDRHQFAHLLVRHGDSIEDTDLSIDHDFETAMRRAEAGDGEALARAMGGRYGSGWWRPSDIIAVLPRITTGRDAVVRQLAWSSPRQDSPLEFRYPWGVVLDAATRRTALVLAGDAADAAPWDAIYKRYDAVLADPKKLAALVLWGDDD